MEIEAARQLIQRGDYSLMNLDKVSGFITSLTDYGKTILCRQLELIILVYANYNHAQDMEQLVQLFRYFKSQYYDQYAPELRDMYKICEKIATTTHNSLYQYKLYTRAEDQDHAYHVMNVSQFFEDIKRNKYWNDACKKMQDYRR